MKILIAPDSFKESLKASDVAHYIEKGIRRAMPDAECLLSPLADGGEGTVDALVNATGGNILKVPVKDPLMRNINSFFGILGDGRTAVIEMAAASGLELLNEEERDPWITSTYGTGQLIRAALDAGVHRIIIGIGGSATNDGGAGMARALGVKLLDMEGNETGPGGGQAGAIETIDCSGLDKRLPEVAFMVASDVQNPLCGENGASYIYGPQKGASGEMVKKLDSNLRHFGEKMEAVFEKELLEMPGAGAAGGLGAGLVAFLDARIQPGFEIIRELTGLEDKVREADLVITGEGKLDEQTKFGKTPHGVALLSKKYEKPVIAIAGTLGKHYEELYDHGFDALFSITDSPMTLKMAMNDAGRLVENTCYAIFKSISLGRRF